MAEEGKSAAHREARERPRSRYNRFIRSPETAERDRDAADLRARGLTYQEIADELGYGNKGDAWYAVRRALREIVAKPAQEVRDLELQRLDAMYEIVLGVLERQHVLVSHGKVIYLGDDPIEDDGPVLQAVDRLLKIQARRAALLGLDAPAKVEAQVIQVTQQDIALQELVAELKAKNATIEGELRGGQERTE